MEFIKHVIIYFIDLFLVTKGKTIKFLKMLYSNTQFHGKKYFHQYNSKMKNNLNPLKCYIEKNIYIKILSFIEITSY